MKKFSFDNRRIIAFIAAIIVLSLALALCSCTSFEAFKKPDASQSDAAPESNAAPTNPNDDGFGSEVEM